MRPDETGAHGPDYHWTIGPEAGEAEGGWKPDVLSAGASSALE